MSINAPRAGLDGQLSHRQILTIMTGLMAGMFMAALHQTIVVTAVRTIADDLQGLQHQAWATTAYLITATITTPLYGKLSDIYGRKPFFLAAISIFLFGSLLCTFSQSMEQLAFFRAVQGIGAGGLFPLALAIIGDVVPPRRRAKYQGYFIATFGVASVLGPLVGGFFAGTETILGLAGWRWVFLFITPIAVAAMIIVARTLNLEHRRLEHRIDWWGAAMLALGLMPLLLVAELGRDWGWSSAQALTCYCLGAFGLVAFVFVEHRMKHEALVPLTLFRNRTVAVASIASVLIGVGMFVGMTTMPLYLQIVKGSTPTEAGLMMVPMTVGMMAGSIGSGQLISRTGRYRIFPIIGAGLMCVAMFLLTRVGADTPLWPTMLLMTLFGLGLGNCMQPITLAVQNAVSARQIGVATSTATFTRQIGGTIGTATFMALLFTQAPQRIDEALDRHGDQAAFQRALEDPANAGLAGDLTAGDDGLLAGVLDDSSFLSDLDPVLARPFLEGFAEAMDNVFVVGALVILVAFAMTWLLPELPLRSASAYAERRAEDAAADRVAVEDAAADPETVGQPEGTRADGIRAGAHPAPSAGPGSTRPAEGANRSAPGRGIENDVDPEELAPAGGVAPAGLPGAQRSWSTGGSDGAHAHHDAAVQSPAMSTPEPATRNSREEA